MKTNKKTIISIILLMLLTVFYFEYSVTICWDSAHYLGYVNILEKVSPFSSWDVVRGPVFPLIIHLGNILFSKSSHGLLVNTYLYYLTMLIFTIKLLDYCFDNMKISNKKKNILKYLFIIFVIINPIIYGYYHCLLTEFVAITLSVISCYYSIVWLDSDCYKDKRKYLFISILFIFLTLFSWFLKQPYVSCGLFPLLVAYIISIFKYWKKKQFILRTISVLSCVLCLFIGIKTWNYILDSYGNDTSSTRNPTNSLGTQLINAIDFLEINSDSDNIYNKKFIKNSELSKKEKNEVYKLINDDRQYVLVYKYDKKNKLYDIDYIKSENGITITGSSAICYVMKTFLSHPLRLIKSYTINYFSIIDVFSTSTNDGVGYTSDKKFDLFFSNEISSIGNKPYSYGSPNMFYLSDELMKNAINYDEPNYASKYLNKTMLLLSVVYVFLFKLIFALLPFILVLSIFMEFVKKFKKYRKIINLIIILLGFSFLHLLLHTITGAIIDRYAIPALITTCLGYLMTICIIFKGK